MCVQTFWQDKTFLLCTTKSRFTCAQVNAFNKLAAGRKKESCVLIATSQMANFEQMVPKRFKFWFSFALSLRFLVCCFLCFYLLEHSFTCIPVLSQLCLVIRDDNCCCCSFWTKRQHTSTVVCQYYVRPNGTLQDTLPIEAINGKCANQLMAQGSARLQDLPFAINENYCHIL